MNKFILFLFSASCLFGATTTMVDKDGTLVYPDKATFFNKNARVLQQDFRIFVDTTQSAYSNYMVSNSVNTINRIYYKDANNATKRTVSSSGQPLTAFPTQYQYYKVNWWTDCEVKVIDKWGNLIYFTSTIALENSQVSKLHPQICDKAPKVFAWLAVGSNSNGGCWGERKELTDFTKSIGASIGSAISGIWIYPSINSTEKRTRSVFNNPDNTILVWRQTTSEGETYNGNKLWRPARLEYYGDFKEVE